MCLWFASGCRLCKSWAGASSQLGGQTRKQMDPFGLNPSHAISSSWPCPSNQQAFLQRRWRGVYVYVEVWGLGGAWNSTCTKQEDRQEPERSSKREGERGTFPYRLCVCWTVLTYGSCLHVGAPCLLCPVLSFFLFRYSLLSALSAKPALCLFVSRRACLFWDAELPHPMRFTGCLLFLLHTSPHCFLALAF